MAESSKKLMLEKQLCQTLSKRLSFLFCFVSKTPDSFQEALQTAHLT